MSDTPFVNDPKTIMLALVLLVLLFAVINMTFPAVKLWLTNLFVSQTKMVSWDEHFRHFPSFGDFLN
jgi:hypothetical protein